jgi:hypothetical protein
MRTLVTIKNHLLLLLIIIMTFSLLECKNRNLAHKGDLKAVEMITSRDSMKSEKAIKTTDSVIFKCNENIVLKVHEKLDSLTVKDIADFLKVFSIKCKNNVEFSEFSNEVLFEVIDKQPTNFIKAICETNDEVEYQIIYDELKSPIHDLIPIGKLRQSIKTTPNICARIDSVLKSLTIASEKL